MGRPGVATGPINPRLEALRLAAEEDRQRRAAEFTARGSDWAGAAPEWHRSWHEHGRHEESRRIAEAARLRAEWERRERAEREARGRTRREVVEALERTPGPFLTLGLTAGASREQVKARHRELALRHHPDRAGDPAEFRRCQVAYEVALVILDRRAGF